MKKSFLTLFVVLIVAFLPVSLSAQESSAGENVKPVKEYIKGTFENGVVINNQTVENPHRKSLDFIIQHRFGLIKNEKDLYGIFAPSNIRLGLTYGITSRLSVGLGVTKNKMQYDLQGKYIILKQAKKKGSPVTLTYYVDISRSTVEKEKFYNSEKKFKEANKMTYFHELMVARKITSHLSLQLGGTYSHYNIIDTAYGKHDFFGGSFVGRYKFSPQSSVVVDFDYLFNVAGIDKDTRPKPNLSIGYELSTGSHQFQVFVCTANAIINQDNRIYNHNDFAKGDLVVGFNITREWGFKK